jgi:hypothetical protein
MVAAVAESSRSASVKLVTEVRGAVAQLWDTTHGEIIRTVLRSVPARPVARSRIPGSGYRKR